MSEQKLPDPPAYDPRVEQADDEEVRIDILAETILDAALEQENLFVCGLLVRFMENQMGARPILECASTLLAKKIIDPNIKNGLPDDIREALGLK